MDEASMLQMPVVETDLVVDTSDCRCPGYVQEECEAEAAQGCVWSDAGESMRHGANVLVSPQPAVKRKLSSVWHANLKLRWITSSPLAAVAQLMSARITAFITSLLMESRATLTLTCLT